MDERTQLSNQLCEDLFLDSVAKGYALVLLTGRKDELEKRINVEISLFKRSMDAQQEGAIEPNIRPAVGRTEAAEKTA